MKRRISPPRNIETEFFKRLNLTVFLPFAFCLFTFFSMFLCFYAVKIPAQDFHTKIRASVENRDYQTAISELETLEKSDKKLFELNNYDYLLARLHEKNGDFAKAAAGFQAVANRSSVLKEYALWHLAQIARSSGNLMLERVLLQEISTYFPNSLLKNAGQARLVRSFFESKNYETVIAQLSEKNPQSATRNPQSDEGRNRENQLLLAQAYLQSGKMNEAREIFTRIVSNLPNAAQPDDFALEAAKNLDLMDGGNENFGKIAPQIAENEHLRRGTIYQFNRNFPFARLHFQQIAERFPTGANAAFASYQIGRSFAQEGNFTQAIIWFERVQAQFPSDPVAKDALYQLAAAFSRVGKVKEAISRYQKFIAQYPDADNLDRAYLNIVDVLRDQGSDIEVLQWTAKTQEVFRGKLPEAIALFSQTRIHLAQNDWKNALVDLDKLLLAPDLGGTRVAGGTNKAEVTFLKGFALENSQKYAEAIDVYLSISDGRSEYYGWRATERLRLLRNNETTREFISAKLTNLTLRANSANISDDVRRISAQNVLRLTDSTEIRAKMLETIKTAYANLPAYQKVPNFKLLEFGRKEVLKEKSATSNQNPHQILADELLFLALYDEASAELEEGEMGRKGDGEKKDFEYTLAVIYKRGDKANRAIAFIEPLWKNVPADYEIELIPRSQIELLYPTPYADSLLKYAPERNVDARFLLSIMRQESRFRPDVKSVAAARGLMQFISTTSDKIALELGKTNFKQDDLYNPPTAILFGSQYLSNLFKQFPNQPQAVAASYNGGEDNMARWLNRSKSDNADKYVAEIAFSQSKDYVYKVLANYRVYQMLYDEKLQSKK